MKKLAYIFMVIAVVLLFVGIALAAVWLIDLVLRKPAKSMGRAALLCFACFLLSCGISGYTSGGADTSAQNDGTEINTATDKMNVNAKEERSLTAVAQTNPVYSKKAKSFAKKYKVSVELMGSLEEAIAQTEFPYSFEDMNGLEYTDDWAGGARYRIWRYDTKADKYYRILVYEKNDTVSALYDITDGRELIYAAADWSDGDGQEAGGIMLVDGAAGEYGKEITAGGESYFWYMVPSGVYLAENQLKYGTLYVVSDESAEDVRQTVQFAWAGDTAEITVEEGTHIELSIQTEVLLTPAEG